MTRRMSIATIITICGLVLVACSDDDTSDAADRNRSSNGADSQSKEPDDGKRGGTVTKTVEPSALPSVDSSSDGAVAIRGQWANDKVRWTISFHEDGSFTEDLGNEDNIRSGNYSVSGDVVSLHGLDGTTVKGLVKGEKIVFKRATVVRL